MHLALIISNISLQFKGLKDTDIFLLLRSTQGFPWEKLERNLFLSKSDLATVNIEGDKNFDKSSFKKLYSFILTHSIPSITIKPLTIFILLYRTHFF